MLHSGCEYYGLQSACYDVPWYDDFFPAEKHSETEQRVILNWWFLLIEVIYHQRMNILSSIGLMTLFQFAFTLHVVLNSVQVHGSKKNIEIPLIMTLSLGFKARRLRPNATCWIGIPCSTWVFMCLVHCPLQDILILQ